MADLTPLSRILLLEDEGLIALDIETALQDAGVAEVTTVSNVADALGAIDGSMFNAAILDLRLGADSWSYDVARRLREKGTPFIFSSGSADVDDAYRDVPLVAKPFSSDQLVAKLIEVTSGATIQAAE